MIQDPREEEFSRIEAGNMRVEEERL